MSLSVGKLRKKGMAVLKIVFSVLLLYFVFRQIPFREVWTTLRESRPGYLLLALLFFVLSKITAAFRLNRYFYQIGIPLSQSSNLKLYLLGMFYNLFLPGGIGGDAYKGYVLHKRFARPVKRIAGVLLLDRISGLFALFVLGGMLLLLLNPVAISAYKAWIIPVLLLALGIYFWLHRKLFPYVQAVFWGAIGYSVLVQISQLIAAYFILFALGIQEGTLPYLLLFLASSIAAVLPITIGGVGSRELVFYYGSLWWKLKEPTALALSLVFFAITAAVSLCGLAYHFRKPELERVQGLREGA